MVYTITITESKFGRADCVTVYAAQSAVAMAAVVNYLEHNASQESLETLIVRPEELPF